MRTWQPAGYAWVIMLAAAAAACAWHSSNLTLVPEVQRASLIQNHDAYYLGTREVALHVFSIEHVCGECRRRGRRLEISILADGYRAADGSGAAWPMADSHLVATLSQRCRRGNLWPTCISVCERLRMSRISASYTLHPAILRIAIDHHTGERDAPSRVCRTIDTPSENVPY